jgi:hypothetical protein
MELIPL